MTQRKLRISMLMALGYRDVGILHDVHPRISMPIVVQLLMRQSQARWPNNQESYVTPSWVPTTRSRARCVYIFRDRSTVLNIFTDISFPYRATQDDMSTPLQRLEVEDIAGHQSIRGWGGVIAVMYEAQWTGLSRPLREREMDVQLSQTTNFALLGWHPEPAQPNQPPISPDAHWCCATRTFSRLRRATSYSRQRLRTTH